MQLTCGKDCGCDGFASVAFGARKILVILVCIPEQVVGSFYVHHTPPVNGIPLRAC